MKMPSSGDIGKVAIGVIIGAIGAFITYVQSTHQQRHEKLMDARLETYNALINAQAQWDKTGDSDKYSELIVPVRKKLALFGSKALVSGLADYWRYQFGRKIKSCDYNADRLEKELAIYRPMRRDYVGFIDRVSDEDLILMIHYCKS